MKTRILIVLLFTFFAAGCSRCPGDIVSAYIYIDYQDDMGRDLLSADTPDHFLSGNIHVYTVENGTKSESSFRAWEITKIIPATDNVLRVDVDVDTTLIELDKNKIDTMVCEIDRSCDNFIVKKVWYNHILKFEGNDLRYFTIKK